MSLREKINDYWIRMVGNRIMPVSAAFIGLGIYDIASTQPGSVNSFPNLLIEAGMPILCLAGGFGLQVFANFGAGTLNVYNHTKKHIERYGDIKDRVAEAIVRKAENHNCEGYCEWQGAYLAAKKFRLEDKMKALKDKYSENIIPHF